MRCERICITGRSSIRFSPELEHRLRAEVWNACVENETALGMLELHVVALGVAGLCRCAACSSCKVGEARKRSSVYYTIMYTILVKNPREQ